MSQGHNRDSLSSTSSFSSRSTGAGRLTPLLSIRVPDAAPFIPSLVNPRPTSSLSEQWTDASASGEGSVDEDEVERELEAADHSGLWEDDEDDEDEEQRTAVEGGFFPRENTVQAQQHHLFRPLGEADFAQQSFTEDAGDSTDADPPSTPVTLPPASLSQRSSASYVEAEGDDGLVSPRNSFPSSDEGGLGIGLGVGAAVMTQHARRLRLQSIEDMRARADAHAGRSLDFDGVGEEAEEGWKDDGVDEQEPEEGVVDLGIGGSGASASVPFPSVADLPSSSHAPEYDEPTPRRSRDLPPLPHLETQSRSSTPSVSVRSPRPSTTSTDTSSDSSTLSLPTAPSVDLIFPNRPSGTFVSVASGHLGRLAADSVAGPARNQVCRLSMSWGV
jgi:hypothetical protein